MPKMPKKMPQRPNGKNSLERWVGALGHPNPTLTENWRFAPNPTQPFWTKFTTLVGISVQKPFEEGS